MADLDSNAFRFPQNISDDTVFVHLAMNKLGFSCEFCELPIADMQLALALALHLKRTQGQPEAWESWRHARPPNPRSPLEAELSEPDIHLRSDYWQVWICVSLANRGESQPFIESSYRIYGSHPDEVWPQIMAKRKAKLGLEFDLWYFEDGTIKPDVIIPDYDPLIPRKPQRHAEAFCIARLPSEAEARKLLRILPAA